MLVEKLKNDPDCVGMLSAGSTGALLVGSIFRLGLIEGLKSPALSSYLPMARGDLVCLLDCGANIQCTPKEMARFALMGDATNSVANAAGYGKPDRKRPHGRRLCGFVSFC